jgi:uncharacterized membrane protein
MPDVIRDHDIIAPLEATEQLPIIRRISPVDLKEALAQGYDDFMAMPTQVLFLCLIYPIAGLLIGRLAFGYDVFPLFYMLASGFALIGPFAAIGLYELSRRREAGLDTSWKHALDILHSPSLMAILGLGALLMLLLAVWVGVAEWIYTASFGVREPASPVAFVKSLFNTREGLRFLTIGNIAGLCFALLAFALSAVSFPLMLDRKVGLAVAITTSIKAIATNPLTMLLWGLIVAAALFLGSLPFLVGLAVVMPVLGHATWHLYRRVIEPDFGPRPGIPQRPRVERHAADFPAVLFTLFKRGSDAERKK